MARQKNKTHKKKAKRTKASCDEKSRHPFGYFDLACSFAALGETKMAFSLLEKAVKLGFREHKWLTEGQSFKGLRKDLRWPAILKKCEANREAYLKSVNVELYRMSLRADREQHKKGLDRGVLERRNARRRRKVRKMLQAGEIKAADDFCRAGWILFRGSDSSDLELSKGLALVAFGLDPKKHEARALAALAEDRYLLSIGKAQIYGTKFRTVRGKNVLEEPYDLSSIADEERKELFGLIMYKVMKFAHRNSEARKRRSRKSRSPRCKKAKK